MSNLLKRNSGALRGPFLFYLDLDLRISMKLLLRGTSAGVMVSFLRYRRPNLSLHAARSEWRGQNSAHAANFLYL